MTVFLAVSACEEEPENITGIVFDTESGSVSDDVFVNVSLTYDTNGNRIANWGEDVGLDAQVRNRSNQLIRNVTIQIESVTPTNVRNDFDASVKSLGTIGAGLTVGPTTYWCFNCNTATEIYLGNFYISMSSSSGTVSSTVVFRVNYTDGGGRNKVYRQNYTLSVR